jgi:hypothetical protein
VRLASVEDEESSPESHVGKVQDIRKNPHVIDADSEQDLPVNCWCIMWTEISTMFHYETCAQFVETVWKKLPRLKLLGGRVILNQTLN